MTERGMVKWAPFNSVINSNDVRKLIDKEKNKIKKPILSEEQIAEIENSIINAYSNKSNISLLYYHKENLYKLNGTITKIDPINKRILFNNKYLYFINIIKIL